MNIVRLPDNYRIIPRGEGITAGKYVRMRSSIAKVSGNTWRMTITLWTSSNQVFNGYGVRVYAHIGNARVHKGTFTIANGNLTQDTFTHDFTITGDTQCYASCICAWCEDGLHTEYRYEFENQTNPDTATYVPPVVVPIAPTTCNASGRFEVGEKVRVTWNAVNGATGYDVQCSEWDSNGGWQGWSSVTDPQVGTSTNHSIGVVRDNRFRIRYRVRAKNSAGASAWSPESNVILHYGVKVNQNGFIWSNVKIWTGQSWENGMTRVWDGKAWITAR